MPRAEDVEAAVHVEPADWLTRARATDPANLPHQRAHAVGQAGSGTDELPVWLNAAALLKDLPDDAWARRSLKVAVVGSHTTGHLSALLPVAFARHAVAVEVYEAPFGQYEQEILDTGSGLHGFAPDVVLLLIDERELRLPDLSADPETDLAAETARWTGLWDTVRQNTSATVLQGTFVPRTDDALGHLSLTRPGSRRRLVRELNLRLGDLAPDGVHLLDLEALAAEVGSHVWNDDRYWHLAKQSVGLGALPALSRYVARVTAAVAGLSTKVVVVDLDNTLWGGVIGEDGVEGIVLGGGPQGEAFQAFQETLLGLRRRGVLLAVASKNNDADAREPFERHPDMRLALSDFVAFRATWDDKAQNIKQLAADLSLGLDSFLFVDDNPFEREAVRHALPMVEVIDLPADATGYARALAEHPTLEPADVTGEDLARTERYQALAQAAEARTAAATPEEYLESLGMTATFAPVDAISLPRVVQLIGKTNQFNLTTRRHTEGDVRALLAADRAVGLTVRLADRFTDHGLVGVLLTRPAGEDLVIDTWLMSCRVLGRRLEYATLAVLLDLARRNGFRRVVGEYIPSAKNMLVQNLYPDAGFETGAAEHTWVFDLSREDAPGPGPITVEGTP